MPIQQIPKLVSDLYRIVKELETLFPKRKFTPDGHLVGSIGEVLVAYEYGLELLPASEKTHDALTSDGRKVQIKATQGNQVALRSQPSYLIVIKITSDGNHKDIYNGPGEIVWKHVGRRQSNGQHSISLRKLIELNQNILQSQRISPHATIKK
jgi:hypothetical protein